MLKQPGAGVQHMMDKRRKPVWHKKNHDTLADVRNVGGLCGMMSRMAYDPRSSRRTARLTWRMSNAQRKKLQEQAQVAGFPDVTAFLNAVHFSGELQQPLLRREDLEDRMAS